SVARRLALYHAHLPHDRARRRSGGPVGRFGSYARSRAGGRSRMTNNSRVGVSIVGIVVVALFSTLLARLWFLQSGAESSLRVQADIASTRVIQTESPRGEILDRNGVVLVKDRPSWGVTVERTLPKKTAARVLGQL